MRMSAAEALERLHTAGIGPWMRLVWVDASMDYETLKRDLRTCRRYFPRATLAGAGWEVEAVSRAVREYASPLVFPHPHTHTVIISHI